MFGAAYQESVFGTIGFVVAGLIGYPFILLYGADPRRPPGILVSISIYLIEVGVLALPIYFLFFRA